MCLIEFLVFLLPYTQICPAGSSGIKHILLFTLGIYLSQCILSFSEMASCNISVQISGKYKEIYCFARALRKQVSLYHSSILV